LNFKFFGLEIEEKFLKNEKSFENEERKEKIPRENKNTDGFCPKKLSRNSVKNFSDLRKMNN
jgi:hypothetical protein